MPSRFSSGLEEIRPGPIQFSSGPRSLSVDRFPRTSFPAHRILLGAGILIGENFAALGRLPPYAHLIALPLAIEGGTGAPTRALAVLASGDRRDG